MVDHPSKHSYTMTLKTHFQLGSLDDCDLRGATLQAATFEGVSLCGCNFEGADLSFCEFYMVPAIGANFQGSKLIGARFCGGTFACANFTNCDLSDAIFLADNMGGAVDLSASDFTGAKLDNSRFASVITDVQTKLSDPGV